MLGPLLGDVEGEADCALCRETDTRSSALNLYFPKRGILTVRLQSCCGRSLYVGLQSCLEAP